jgi:hypothetical protein
MGPGIRGIAAALGTSAVMSLCAVAPAGAAFGELEYESCDTGRSSHPACDEIPTTTVSGLGTGLEGTADAVVSPDGEHVYAISQSDASVVRFDRDPMTGDLTFADCVTGATSVTPCTATADATANGVGSGMFGPNGLALSPGGTSLYVVNENDDSVAHFQREPAPGDPDFGELTYGDCYTGDTGVTACQPVTGATAGGTNSGLHGPHDVVVVPNSVYVMSASESAIWRFSRTVADGTLTAANCVSGNTAVAPPLDSCTQTPGATADGTDSGMHLPTGISVSPDLKSLYLSSGLDDAVVWFDRAANGDLTWNDCISGETTTNGAGPCTDNGFDEVNGIGSGLDSLNYVVASADDGSVYVASANDNGVAGFDRDPDTGDLAFEGCITGELANAACDEIASATANGDDSGLEEPHVLETTPDGRSLYVGLPFDAAVASFLRNPGNGAIAYQGCISGDTDVTACTPSPDATAGGTNSGLDRVGDQGTLGVSPDGKSVYAPATFDDAIAEFDRESPPVTQISGPTGTTSDNTPDFTFSTPGDATTVSFTCSVDGAAPGPCSDSTGPTGAHTAVALPDGPHTFAVSATDSFGNTEAPPASVAFTIDTTVPPPGGGGGGGATPDTDPPETTIASGPEKKSKKKKAKFEFTADEAGSSFECNLDGKGFEPCAASETFKVKKGKHTLEVRAKDPAGNVDGTPATESWKRKKKK